MLLAIDIGNTNTQLGLYSREDGRWCSSWRAQTVHERMGDEWAVLVRNFFDEDGYHFDDVHAVVMASVVPVLTPRFIEMSERYLGHTPLNVRADTVKLDMGIRVDNPRELGADRVANAAAAHALYGGPAVVVDFGTSTNFDVIDAQGDYLGGSIALGIGLAHDALVSRAAQLYKVDLLPPPSAIGANTVHAMQSGLFLGYVAMIEGLIQRIKAALGEPGAKVIATGGLAGLIAGQTDTIDEIAPDLTLDGLRLIWEQNQ